MLRHYLILQFTSLIILNQSLYLTCTLFILGPERQFLWPLERREQLWTRIAHAKIESQIKVARLNGCPVQELESELEAIEVNDISNREAVVARKYFPLLFGKDFSRRQENQYNAALDYGYAVLLAETNQSITENGYLMELGIHHQNRENRFNLGSDLMEPFRPVIDYWVTGQKFAEFNRQVRVGLVDAMHTVIKYNGIEMLTQNAVRQYVRECLDYLSGERDEIEVKVEFKDEVPNHALDGHV
ncbi:type II CRISPR-associated endonuclease Cas1 [Limosilactobacillus fermentum]|uniref:type II CRISPR-associated endonuclease Cas1 n=1 Tax=Limosilactobacillus fermentum TaxID=1613 RepID=UPI00209ACF19|nr:type II CRISPR-associated endonuclease Cas1 [Limosilactobacillus fermentum]